MKIAVARGLMVDDTEIFRTTLGVASLNRPDIVTQVDDVMVDKGLELRVDLARRELTPAGPVPAALSAAQTFSLSV